MKDMVEEREERSGVKKSAEGVGKEKKGKEKEEKVVGGGREAAAFMPLPHRIHHRGRTDQSKPLMAREPFSCHDKQARQGARVWRWLHRMA
jgi:hypothetical protein